MKAKTVSLVIPDRNVNDGLKPAHLAYCSKWVKVVRGNRSSIAEVFGWEVYNDALPENIAKFIGVGHAIRSLNGNGGCSDPNLEVIHTD